MPSEDANKRIIGVSACLAIVGVGLIVTGFASDHWIISEMDPNSTIISTGNGNSNRTVKKYGKITFGLFQGEVYHNVGLGKRQREKFELKCDLSESICGYMDSGTSLKNVIKENKNSTKDLEEDKLFRFPMFVTSMIMLCLSMTFGLVATGFSFFNIFGKPIETITGIAGLYVWNAFALIFALVGIGVYMGLFFSELTEVSRYLHFDIIAKTYVDDTRLDWSFYCVVGAAGAYILNLVLLVLSGRQCMCSYLKSAEKKIDDGIILY